MFSCPSSFHIYHDEAASGCSCESIQHSFQPSSILIRTGGDDVELLDAVKAVRLGCSVRIASSPVRHRTTKDYRKYQSLYYAWRLSVVSLEEENRRLQQLYQRFYDVVVVRVTNPEELKAWVDIKKSGGWRANTIPAGLNSGALQEDFVRSGFVLLLGNHPDAQ